MPRRPDLPCADCGKLLWRSTTSLPAGQARCRECRNKDQSHGITQYKKGCRCDDCREANNLQARKYAAKVKAREGVSPTQKYRKRSNVTCSDCDSYLASGGASRGDASPRCAPCGLVHRAAKRKAKAFRRRAVASVQASAQGTSGVGVWVQGACLNCGAYFVRKGAASGYCTKVCRRADKRSSDFITKTRRRAIYERDNWTCQICSDPVDQDLDFLDDWAASLDHIIPRSRGGSHDESNLRLAHRWCNSVRGDETYYSDADLAA